MRKIKAKNNLSKIYTKDYLIYSNNAATKKKLHSVKITFSKIDHSLISRKKREEIASFTEFVIQATDYSKRSVKEET